MANVKTFKKTRKKKYRKKEIKTMKKNMGGGSLARRAAEAAKKAARNKGVSKKGIESQLKDKAKDKMNQKMNEKEELTNKVTDKISGKSDSGKGKGKGKGKEEDKEKNKVSVDQESPELKAQLRKYKNDAEKVEMTSDTVTSRSTGESPKQRLEKIMKKAKENDASCMKIITAARESGDYHMSTGDKLKLAAVVAAGTALELTGVGAGAGMALEASEVAATVGEAAEGAALAGEAAEGAEAGELAEGAESAEGSAGRRAAKKALDNIGNNDDDEDPTKNIKIQDPHKMLEEWKSHLPDKIYKRLVNCIRQSNNLKKDAIETYRALKNKNKMTCNPKQKNPKACGGKGCPDCGDAKCFCPRSATKADQMIQSMQNLMKTTKGPLPYIFLLITKILLTKIK